MKRTVMLCLAALLALTMCACAADAGDSTYTVTKNGTDYVVDQENGTISDGTYTYQFTASGSSAGYSITITYPDGSTYAWQNNGNFGTGSASLDYDPDRYVDAFVLCGILEGGIPRSGGDGVDGGRLLLALVLLALGLFNIISPYTAWYLRYGWRYKDTEPSELALGVGRLGGVVVVIIAAILLFV